ncbi:MAG TPA: hypothetical protein DCY49_00720 [Candidatus Jacksonbacteria bacterium]|nr:hypothetical protein [Candidatus Jacksonbacteria bacterium]
MDTLAKKFSKKFTGVWGFMPNMVFGDSPIILMFILWGISALLVSVCATYCTRQLMRRARIVDHPSGGRKHHTTPIPLGGGLACFVAFALVSFIAILFIGEHEVVGKHLIGMTLGGLVLVIGGLIDDTYNLKPWHQCLFPFIAIAIVIASGIGLSAITNPFIDGLEGSEIIKLAQMKFEITRINGIPYYFTLPADSITFVWILGMVYTTKFLDGVDGLVAGVTAIGAGFLVIVGLFLGQITSPLLGIILLGVMLGFLVFNFSPASIFLGEGGSTWAGFMLATLAILSEAKIAITLVVMGLAIIDVGVVIYKRLVKEKRSPFAGDRNHMHLRLLDMGFSAKRVSIVYYLFALVLGTAGLMLRNVAWIWLVIIVILVASVFVLFVHHASKRITFPPSS